MKTNALLKILLLLTGIAILISACSTPVRAGQASQSPQQIRVIKPSGLREVSVENVTVQIGVGSPMPVEAIIAGTWPDLCAQLAEIKQTSSERNFDIRLMATADQPGCPPDQLGLPFRITIPLNMVEKPFGSYTVTINGVATTFSWNGKPTEPERTLAPATGNRFSFAGVSLELDPAIAAEAKGEIAPESLPSAETPYWSVLPQLTGIFLSGYPQVKSIYTPSISVYPVEDYRKLSPEANKTIDNLKNLLARKPANAEQIPFLPIKNAGQVFHSNVQYLDFQNGNGVRFLAIYAQYPAPVNNADLFYTFQGLTKDGRHFVSVVMPVNHPSLPTDLNAISRADMDQITQAYDKYRADMAAKLSAEPGNRYTPDLLRLDALIESLAIE